MSDLEKKAAQAHEIWSNWMKHFFRTYMQSEGSQCTVFVVPMNVSSRWQRQMKSPYKDLLESEKESDREVAKEYLMETEE